MRGQNRGSDPRKKKSRDQGRRKPGINEAISSERKSGGPLYSGSIPPWDESLGEYRELRPDEA